MREQTGADKIYVLKRFGETIILPTKESPNHFAMSHPEYDWLSKNRDYALSHLAMVDKFVPALKDHFEAKGMSADEISQVVGMLFEDQKYLGQSWHRRLVTEDRFDPGEVWVVGNGKQNSFYGVGYAGRIVSVVTNLDDLSLN